MRTRVPIRLWGHPDEVVGKPPGVRLGDVAEAMEDFSYSRRTNTEIFARYSEACRKAGREPGAVSTVGRILSMWGCPAVQIFNEDEERYVRGRIITMERLRRNWPRLFPAPSQTDHMTAQ